MRIRSGLLRQEIPLASIQAVFPTRNPLVAAAWSLDRLQVNYQLGKRSLCALIAPRDTASFLRELAEHDYRSGDESECPDAPPAMLKTAHSIANLE